MQVLGQHSRGSSRTMLTLPIAAARGRRPTVGFAQERSPTNLGLALLTLPRSRNSESPGGPLTERSRCCSRPGSGCGAAPRGMANVACAGTHSDGAVVRWFVGRVQSRGRGWSRSDHEAECRFGRRRRRLSPVSIRGYHRDPANRRRGRRGGRPAGCVAARGCSGRPRERPHPV
jgi:hypothetical protein